MKTLFSRKLSFENHGICNVCLDLLFVLMIKVTDGGRCDRL